jgi:hypothetical protein
MNSSTAQNITDVIGDIPYRMDFAGGWIDQPFISRVNRLDYDHEGGLFPRHIESNNDSDIADWLERVIQMIPVAPRPPRYNPLIEKHLDAEWIDRLGRTGHDCYAAIHAKDTHALGRSMNECMNCWEAILPAHGIEYHVLKRTPKTGLPKRQSTDLRGF